MVLCGGMLARWGKKKQSKRQKALGRAKGPSLLLENVVECWSVRYLSCSIIPLI